MCSIIKASVVERFNRKSKNMWKQFMHNGSYKWIDILPRLVKKNYNTRKHRTIDLRPVDFTPAIVDRLLINHAVYNCVKIAAPSRYKVGDSVRVSKFKTIFDKGYTPN